MYLIVQIPCHNEEETLPEVLSHIPRKIPGVSKLEIVVIDDGSTDRTIEIAKQGGAHHIINFKNHKGLASAFRAGLDYALQAGADVVVNTDGDHQYPGENIPNLIQPILAGEADVVIGERPIEKIEDFSWAKKRGQRIGSAMVRRLADRLGSSAISRMVVMMSAKRTSWGQTKTQLRHLEQCQIKSERSSLSFKPILIIWMILRGSKSGIA